MFLYLVQQIFLTGRHTPKKFLPFILTNLCEILILLQQFLTFFILSTWQHCFQLPQTSITSRQYAKTFLSDGVSIISWKMGLAFGTITLGQIQRIGTTVYMFFFSKVSPKIFSCSKNRNQVGNSALLL